MPKDCIHYEKLFVLLAGVGALIREVSILIHNLEENSRNEEIMNETSGASLNLLENIQILKEDLKNVFLKARAETSQLCFPISDGPLFMTLLLRNLNDWVNSNAYSVVLIKEKIGRVKEDLEHIRSFFGIMEQELHRDLWTCVLGVEYEAEHAINSILARDHVERNSSIAGKIIVGFEEETEWIIRKLMSGPNEIDVISIVGMLGIGKSTLAYRVYYDKYDVGHFKVRAWCTVDQEHNEKKMLQKIFNQVISLKERVGENDIDDEVADKLRKRLFGKRRKLGAINEKKILQKIFNQVISLKERVGENDIDDEVADKLRKRLFGKRYLIVLDELWDTAIWDGLTRPFPSEFQKGSRVILTSRKKEVVLHGKCHSDLLDL
ncbi:hypothetical protein CQW23_12710 [Capsicum baccatum]|uniref:NB-ARC domain-containing protein n=1 Tax=Capsicum baccatum TaxID=33114 RepID=A0A2G2WTH3_CAPBA|nr:hypothetical protein CQW23_12710 [Capsicum baccatum]